MKRTAAVLAVLVSAVFVLVGPASVAGAAPYTTQGISLSNSTPPAGGPVTVTADGFKPGSTVQITVDATNVGSGVANANGIVTVTVTVPAGLAVGSTHTISAVGSAPSGAALTRSTTITIAAATALPRTGPSNIAAPLALGVGAVVIGGLLVLFARRHQLLRH